MSGIALSQPGGVGSINAAGANPPSLQVVYSGVRNYPSFTGTTASWAWTFTDKPAGSSASFSSPVGVLPVSSPNLRAPFFTCDKVGNYTIQLVDSGANTYTLNLTAVSTAASSFETIYLAAMSPTATAAANTAALIAAVSAASAAGGGTVFVPTGDYPVIVPNGHGSSALHLVGVSNVTIRGAGRYGARLIDAGAQASASELYPTEQGDPGGTAAFLTLQDCTDVHIKDLGFVGKGVFNQASAGQTAVNKKAIYFKWTISWGTTDCSVTDCYFTLIEGEAVFGDGWPTRLHVDRNHFVRCLSNQINYGSSSQAVNKSIDCSADDNVIESPGASSFQGGGTNYSFSRNKISMLPADAAITTSTAVLVVNSINFLHENNIFHGLIYAGGTPIVRFGFQGDADGNIGSRIRANTFSSCQILGSAADPTTAIIAIDSTYGPQVYSAEANKFIACSEQNHASYPNVVAMRLLGAGVHAGVIGPNEVIRNGVANPLNTGLVVNAGVPVGNVIVVRPHVFDASVTTPYTFTVSPSVFPQTYTVTNPTTDRALNVTGDTLAQGLQVLGTLIADLQAQGLIK